MIEKIRSSSCLNSCSSSVNLSELFLSPANNIVCRAALGKKYDGEDGGKRYKQLLRRVLDLVGVFNMGDYIPSLAWVNGINGWDAKVGELAKEMDEFLEEVVQEHVDRYKRPNGDSGSVEIEGSRDFVDILLEIQREKISSCSPIHGDTIKALIWDVLGAGIDTMFTTLEWTTAELIRHPQITKKLQSELFQSPHASLRKLSLGSVNQYIMLMPEALYMSMDKYLQGLFILANDPAAEVRKLSSDSMKLGWVVLSCFTIQYPSKQRTRVGISKNTNLVTISLDLDEESVQHFIAAVCDSGSGGGGGAIGGSRGDGGGSDVQPNEAETMRSGNNVNATAVEKML
ncbi:hypothetical protein RHGRI_009193 [Rhododendron griersonianum]|uniref:Uncharacterized protein n=1 Tax=Rhododendron griersonianum TaxID=479676 RepID=A0AAV6L548_9ERIC|nr:hypothetical protein RHGRI_009193 [Rhododendron griersonianum]